MAEPIDVTIPLLAMMTATLEAGDRANGPGAAVSLPREYAERAAALLVAVQHVAWPVAEYPTHRGPTAAERAAEAAEQAERDRIGALAQKYANAERALWDDKTVSHDLPDSAWQALIAERAGISAADLPKVREWMDDC